MTNEIFRIGGDLPVHRMGYGAMRLTGPGVWGPPENPSQAAAVLRRAIELGVDFIDTADVYGPGDNERLIRDTLAPYKTGLTIGTKAMQYAIDYTPYEGRTVTGWPVLTMRRGTVVM